MIVKKALRHKKSGGGTVSVTYNTNTDTPSREQFDTIIQQLAGDEVKTLTPTTMTSRIMLRNAYNGGVRFDIIDYGTNYDTYVYDVQPGDVLDVVVTGTAGGSATFLAGAFYNDNETLDHTTAVAAAWNAVDTRKVVGHSRITVPDGAVVFAISQYVRNTVTVKLVKFSRIGAVEDKQNNSVIPYNENIPPFFDGQMAYDATNSKTYISFNNQWKLITTT